MVLTHVAEEEKARAEATKAKAKEAAAKALGPALSL